MNTNINLFQSLLIILIIKIVNNIKESKGQIIMSLFKRVCLFTSSIENVF